MDFHPTESSSCSHRSEAANPRSGVKIVALRGPGIVLITVEKVVSRRRMNNEAKGLQFLVN